jgi:hypothetical protein
MKVKTPLISACVAAIGIVIMPLLGSGSDGAFAQSSRKMGSVIQSCYTTDGRNVPCDQLAAENKKAAQDAKKKTK